MSPLGLWNKEVDRMNGEGRKFSPHELLLVTTKRAEAKLDEAGLCFKDLTFICPENGVGAFQSELGGRRKTVKIHYDEGATDRICIQRKELHRLGVVTVGPKHKFIECPLSQRDAEWAGHSFSDFGDAYKKHTEETQSVYEIADAAKGLAAEAIENLNAGKPLVSESSTSGDNPGRSVTPDHVTATGSPPTSTQGSATTNEDGHENVSPPVEARISAGLRGSRNKRTKKSP